MLLVNRPAADGAGGSRERPGPWAGFLGEEGEGEEGEKEEENGAGHGVRLWGFRSSGSDSRIAGPEGSRKTMNNTNRREPRA